MTENQRKAWYDEAMETMDDLDPNKHTKENFTLYGACLAVLGHGCSSVNETINQTDIAAETVNIGVIEPTVVDYVPESMIDEYQQESMQHFIDYMREKSQFQLTNAPLHDDYAHEHLKRMLETDENIAVMLYNSADSEERALIVESYKSILKKIKPD